MRCLFDRSSFWSGRPESGKAPRPSTPVFNQQHIELSRFAPNPLELLPLAKAIFDFSLSCLVGERGVVSSDLHETVQLSCLFPPPRPTVWLSSSLPSSSPSYATRAAPLPLLRDFPISSFLELVLSFAVPKTHSVFKKSVCHQSLPLEGMTLT